MDIAGIEQQKCSITTTTVRKFTPFGHYYRYIILLISLLAFTLVSANTTSFSLTIICMVGNRSNGNGTHVVPQQLQYPLSVKEQNSLFSAAALGSVLSGLAITSLISRFGLRAVLATYGFLSAFASLALPPIASLGFAPLFAIRMLQGAAGPAQFVMIGAIARDWAPVESTGAYLMLLSSHFQFGRVMSMPLAAVFCDSYLGWSALYYLQGLLTVVAFTVFLLFFRDHPKGHPYISEFEVRKICRGKSNHQSECAELTEGLVPKKGHQPVPYWAILSDVVVWVVLLTYWSDEIGFEILGQFGPTYLNRILGIDIRHTGLLSALPYLLSVLVKIFAGWLYSRLPCASERVKINLFTALSQLGMAFCFFSLAILPRTKNMPSGFVQIVYSCINLFCGLDFLGVVKCSQRISQHFSHVLMALNSIISSVTVLLLPLVITFLAPLNLVEEWSRIFAGIGSLQLFMVLLFFAFCNSEPRPWAKQMEKCQQNSKNGEMIYL